MKPLEKPNLAVGDVVALDDEVLPPELARYLASLLPSNLDGKKASDFIRRVDRSVSMLGLAGSTGAADMLSQLERMASASRALLQAINSLDRDTVRCLEAHAFALVALQGDGGPMLPRHVVDRRLASRDGVCEQAWEAAQALETSARYAASQVEPRKHIKDGQVRARQFVRQVADDFLAVFAVEPPKGQELWFAYFCAELGRHVGLEAGPRVVRSALTPSRGVSA